MATKRPSTRRKSSSRRKPSTKRTSSGRGRSKKSASFDSVLYDEIILIGVILVCVLLFLANIGFGGSIGEGAKKILTGLFGSMSAVFPLFLAALSVYVYFQLDNPLLLPKLICAAVFFENLCILFQLPQSDDYVNSGKTGYLFSIDQKKGGGFAAARLCAVLKDKIGTVCTVLVALVLILICFILFFEISVVDFIRDFATSFSEGYEEGRIRRMEDRERRLQEEEKEERIRRKNRELRKKEEERLLRMEQKRKGITSNTKLKKPNVDIRELLVNHPEYEEPDSDPIDEVRPSSMDDMDEEYGVYLDGDQRETEYGHSFFDEAASRTQDRINRKWDKIREQRKAEGEARRNALAKEIEEIEKEEETAAASEIESEEEKHSKLWTKTYDSTSPEEFDFRSMRPVKTESGDSAIRDMMSRDDIVASETAVVVSEVTERASDKEERTEMPEYAVAGYSFDEPEAFDSFSGSDALSAKEEQTLQEEVFDAEQSFSDVPVEEPPVDETLFTEIPVEDTSVEETPVDETFAAEKPVAEAPAAEKSAKPVAVKPAEVKVKPLPKYVHKFPPLSLLTRGGKSAADSAAELKETALLLEETLESFGVKAKVLDYTKGPTVTRFEIQPPTGVKVSKILGLVDDIKLKLAAADIRIEAPVPGKSVVGIEVPNKSNSMVMLGDLLSDSEFRENTKRSIAFAVGKDLGNKTIVADIAKMPHVLIAGATGSGKSVCINTLIMSILFKYSPDEVKLIMVDPKVVELSVYNGIPHLLIPVVTDPKLASSALQWGVNEMMDRYQKFADAGVRDLAGYNKKVMENRANDPNFTAEPLYKLVIIVDELADLMMVSPGEVEESIVRLAQLARAAGIHLVLATQRPSVNVITGLIKANMPSRIAFSVSSGVDSRTILDMYGAEKLLGHGDMLYYPQGLTKPARLQGAFVSDEEVQAVVEFLKKQVAGTDFESKQTTQITQTVQSVETGSSAAASSGPERDEYFDQAAKFIIDKDRASIGALQRVFKIGFNRAARIMDQLCEAGIVGEEEGTKPRRVLMSEEQYEAWKEEFF